MVVITSDAPIFGNLLMKSGSGISKRLEFNNLVVNDSGSITITATGTSSGMGVDTIVNFEKEHENIEINFLSYRIEQFKETTLEFKLVNQHKKLLIKNITLDISDGISYNKYSTINGICKINKSYPKIGYYYISAVTSDGTYFYKKLQVGFNMTINIGDQENQNFETYQRVSIIFEEYNENYGESVYLYLDCIECSNSTFREYSSDLEINYIQFYIKDRIHSFYVYILSSGTFRWRVSSFNLIGAITDIFKVENPSIFIISYFSQKVTSPYLLFLYTIEIRDKNYNYYDSQFNVTIQDYSGALSISDKTKIIDNGQRTITIYYKDDVYSQRLNVISNKYTYIQNYSEQIYVYPNKIDMYYKQGWIPKIINENFKFLIQVKDFSFQTKVSLGIYKIYIRLISSNSDFIESQTRTITNGEIMIDDLNVNSSGNYKFIISCEFCEEYNSDWFEINSDKCEFSAIPLCILGSLLLVIILCTIAFNKTDKNVEEALYLNHPYKILIFHPFFSLLFKQPRNIRLMNSLQLFTSEINILMAIGVMFFYYDTPEKVDEKDFSEFDLDQVTIGAKGWAFAILLTIIMFIFKMYSIVTSDLRRYYFTVCFVLTLLDCTAIIYMNLNYCKNSIESWAKNFYIFFVVDIILIQHYLSILAIYFTKLDLKIPKQITIEIEIENCGIHRIDENNNPFVETAGND